MVDFLRKGGFRGFWREMQESIKRGLCTDAFLEVIQREKTFEAVVSISLTYYAYSFVSFSKYASLFCLLSMLSATKAVVSGAMQTIHLGTGHIEDCIEDD